MVERPFVALGGSGVLYRVDVVSAAQYEHPTTPCPAEQAYSLPVDVSAPDGSVHVVGLPAPPVDKPPPRCDGAWHADDATGWAILRISGPRQVSGFSEVTG